MPVNYKLLDCGNFEKLESFAGINIRRPAPAASCNPALHEWQADLSFTDKEEWVYSCELPQPWIVDFDLFKLSLRTAAKGQIGVFPEQLHNWRWLAEKSKLLKPEDCVLNVFAYTGGSSMAVAASGCEVSHVDASKPAVNWARENGSLNDFENIRWIVDDAVKFMKREVKRGKRYAGIILDPPAFGRGPKGSTWKLKRDLPELIDLSIKLLQENPAFYLLTWHDPELDSKTISTLLKDKGLPNPKKLTTGENFLTSPNNTLNAGYYCRWENT